jgi:hypothetical protein
MSLPIQTLPTGRPAFVARTADGRNAGPLDGPAARIGTGATLAMADPAGWIAAQIAAGGDPVAMRDNWSRDAATALDLLDRHPDRVTLGPEAAPPEDIPPDLVLLADLLLAQDDTARDRLRRLRPRTETADPAAALDRLARHVADTARARTDTVTGPQAVAVALAEQIDTLEWTLIDTHRRAVRFQTEMRRAVQNNVRLRHELQQARDNAHRLHLDRDRAQSAVDQLLESTSWRVTTPLRRVALMLRRR